MTRLREAFSQKCQKEREMRVPLTHRHRSLQIDGGVVLPLGDVNYVVHETLSRTVLRSAHQIVIY